MTSPELGPHTDKKSLRKLIRQTLADLSEARRLAADQSIREQILAHPAIQEATGIFTCWSFGTEVDTRRLVEDWLKLGKRVFLPRVEDGERTIHVHEYPCPMKPYRWGLEQPAAETPTIDSGDLSSAFQVAVILGLAFDEQRYRLGYGGGYFDRFLPDAPFTTIGLAYEEQVVQQLPNEPHDIPLDVVVVG